MNELQGKHLDQRVRQALDSLTDVPVPGTAFDAEKLWAQVRPELAPQRTGRKQRLSPVWWLAASLAGVLLIWLGWLQLPSHEQRPVAIQRNNAKPEAGYLSAPASTNPTQETSVATSAAVGSGTNRQHRGSEQGPTGIALKISPKRSESTEAPQPELAINVPEQLPVPISTIDSDPISQPMAGAVGLKPAATASKRRFQVVHENELKDEEEVLSVQVRSKGSNDRFVRLGTGSPVSSSSDEQSPAILLPLNRKSTQ